MTGRRCMRARQPSIAYPFRSGPRPAGNMPVRSTATQKSGPHLSPGSGCLAPAGLRHPERLSPEPDDALPFLPSPGDLAPYRPSAPETAALIDSSLPSRRPPARQRPLRPCCLPTDQNKELLGDGGSLRGGRAPLSSGQRALPPSTKYPAYFPLPCSSPCSQRASRSAASTERGPGRAKRCSSTSSTRPERTALRPR